MSSYPHQIKLPKDQRFIFVGDLPALIAKAVHPRNWDFWESRSKLFTRLVTKVWHRVTPDFSGEVEGAEEVLSILRTNMNPEPEAVLDGLAQDNLLQVHIGGVHFKYLSDAVASGSLTVRNPFKGEAMKEDALGTFFSNRDMVEVTDFLSYMSRFGIDVVGQNPLVESETDSWIHEERPRGGIAEVRGRAILSELALLGLDPLALPMPSKRNSHKDQLKKLLAQRDTPGFERCSRERRGDSVNGDTRSQYEKAFDRAWEWLLGENLIKWSKQE